MHFNYQLDVPPNTPETAPQVTVLPLDAGVITHVDILFPPGLAGLVHLALKRALHQVYPLSPSDYYASDDEAIKVDDVMELEGPPYQLEAHCWSEDDTYTQPVIVRINVLPSAQVNPPDQQLGLLQRIARGLGVR